MSRYIGVNKLKHFSLSSLEKTFKSKNKEYIVENVLYVNYQKRWLSLVGPWDP